MGLLSGGNKAQSYTSTTNTSAVSNVALDGIEGTAILVDGGNVSLTQSDAGAIAAGARLGSQAIQLSSDVASDAFGVAGDALAAARQSFAQSLGAVADLADKTSASTDSRVQAIATETVRAVVLAVVVAIVIPRVFGGRA